MIEFYTLVSAILVAINIIILIIIGKLKMTLEEYNNNCINLIKDAKKLLDNIPINKPKSREEIIKNFFD